MKSKLLPLAVGVASLAFFGCSRNEPRTSTDPQTGTTTGTQAGAPAGNTSGYQTGPTVGAPSGTTGGSQVGATTGNTTGTQSRTMTDTSARSTSESLQAGARDTYNTTKDSLGNAWDNVAEYSYDRRSDFRDRTRALSAELDAKVSELQASRASADASASRQTAHRELTDARATFDSKVEALGDATSATWTSARAEVISAWDRTVAAYRKAQADAS